MSEDRSDKPVDVDRSGAPPCYTDPVCRGCFILGSACGRCQRCDHERHEMINKGNRTAVLTAVRHCAVRRTPHGDARELFVDSVMVDDEGDGFEFMMMLQDLVERGDIIETPSESAEGTVLVYSERKQQ